MATQLPHHLDLTDQDTSIASHKRSFHKNIMLKSKHIKNLFISHTRGDTPHQTYCRLREETRILTPHINLWRFFKKPPPRSENSAALLQIKNQEPCQNSSPQENSWTSDDFPLNIQYQEPLTISNHPSKAPRKKFKKKNLFCSLFLHNLSL